MAISKQLINGFIQSELKCFKKHFSEIFVHDFQDERSLAIAWLCYYFNDSISKENVISILNFVDDVYSREDYSKHGWYRISALQASAFILSSKMFYANSLIQHVDCGQGWARGFIMECLGLICPLIPFNNQYLLNATKNNIEFSHTLYEENVMLYLSTKGSNEEKIIWLDDQIKNEKKDYKLEFFNSIKYNGRFNRSEFFVTSFNKTKSYLIFKFLSNPTLAEIQTGLFDLTDINFNELVNLEKKHPLTDCYIDLSFLVK